jgi:hypothetical protein
VEQATKNDEFDAARAGVVGDDVEIAERHRRDAHAERGGSVEENRQRSERKAGERTFGDESRASGNNSKPEPGQKRRRRSAEATCAEHLGSGEWLQQAR